MVRPALRSRGLRRIYKRTPGGSRIVHFERRKSGKPVCWRCGKPLAGVPSGSPLEVRALSKSGRRPSRPYGGHLCPSCLAELLARAVIKGVL